MKNADTALVIPTFNGEGHIRDLLDSVKNQDFANFNTYISDNGSRDETLAKVTNFSRENDLNIKIFDSSKERGKAFSLNNAIRKIRENKILTVDQDDEISRNYIRGMSAALDRNDFVAAAMDSQKLNCNWKIPPRDAPCDQKIGRFAIKLAAGGSLGFSRKMFDDLGGFREDFDFSTNDVDFCVRAQNAGYNLELIEGAELFYRFRETIFANFQQGVYYGRGNREIEKIYPGIRGGEKNIREIMRQIFMNSEKFFAKKDARAKYAHEVGKLVGYGMEKFK